MKMERINVIYLLVALQAILVTSSPIDVDYMSPPARLYHDSSAISYSEITDLNEQINYRLPNNTSPIKYHVSLHTDIHKDVFEFSGKNVITLKALEKSDSITLHGRQIEIKTASLNEVNNKTRIEIEYPKNPADKTEFLVFKLKKETLQADKIYELTVEYNGTLRGDNGGFYYSKYKNKEGKEVYLATTQFESTDSRHGFPCYDEPGIKANFTIEIKHGDNYTALSNMNVLSTEKNGAGYNLTKFAETEKMSSYLVAFVVSDFTANTKVGKRVPHAVYSRPGTENDRNFGLDSSISILEAIEDYVGVPYTFPKMDQISIPDFAAGAMENWGLVTYREEMLLYNEKSSTIRTKTVVANTVAHEYGHQWFGNLVSPQWWSYLWLNEGFASLFAYIGVEIAYDKWDIMEHFIVAEYQRALKSDEGKNKRPMTHYVEAPKAIVGLFDSVSYSKAACVIQMMRKLIGEKAFKKSLNIYLTRMNHTSANEMDLFTAFQDGAKAENVALPGTIEEIMGSWSRQGGFPLLNVTRDYEKGTFTVKQNGFVNEGETGDTRKWWIPFNYATGKKADFSSTASEHLLKDPEMKVEPKDDDKLAADDWLILNKQLSGYYRVNYDEKNWNLIIKQLKKDPSKIHKYNRAQLIFDSYRLSLNNNLKIEKFFDLMEYLPKETEYSPWSSVDEAFSFYKNRFHDHNKIYKNLKFFILKNVQKIYEKLGIKDLAEDRHFDKYIRSIAINWACTAGSKSCLKTTNERIKQLVEKKTEIEPNLQAVIYCNGLKEANEKQFNYMFERMLKSTDQAERQLIMGSLGCTHKKEFLKKFAESTIDHSNNLRTQERINVLKSIYSKSKEGFEAAVEFLKTKFDEYSKLIPGFGQTSPLDDAVKGLSALVVSEDQKKLMNELVKAVEGHKAVDEKIKEKVEANIKKNLEWIKKHEGPVKSSLDDFYKRNSAAQMFVSIMAFAAVLFVSIKNAF